MTERPNVVTNQIRIPRTQKSMSQKKKGKKDSVSQAVFLQAAGEYEEFSEPYFGLYILRTADVPTSDCEISHTPWSSDEAFIYEKKEGGPLKVADILRVKGKRNGSEAVSLALKQPITICVRHGRHTAILEVFVIELKANEALLQVPHMQLLFLR